MQYTKLGKSELNVSRICMGCMGFGDAQRGQHSWTIDEPHTREIVRRGLELGINFLIRPSPIRAVPVNSTLAVRCVILPGVIRLWLRPNSSPVRQRKSQPVSVAGSTSSG